MSASKKFPHAIQYEVKVAGETFTESDANVTDLVVETTVDKADRFQLTLLFPFDREKQKFPDMAWDKFKAGKKVDIKLGWGKDASMVKVFKGKIKKSKSSFSGDKGPKVGLSGYGMLHEMMRGTNDKSWKDKKLKKIVNEVVGKTFGDKEVKDAKMKRPKIVQHNQSDYRFIKDLANKYGYRFYADRNKAIFKPRKEIGGGEPVATLHHGTSLSSFSGQINKATKVKKVEVRYWDMEKEKEVVGKASTDAKNDKKEVFRIPCFSKKEAKEMAKSKLKSLSSDRVKANGEARRGIPKLNAGEKIKIKEAGKKFSKTYFVKKATHRVSSSGFKTSFDIKEVPE